MPFGKTLPLPPSMSVSDTSLATPKGTLRKAQSLLQMSEQDSDAHFLCTESGLSQEAQMLAEMIPFLNEWSILLMAPLYQPQGLG